MLEEKRRERLGEFIAPFRVKSRARVKLSRDFDPSFNQMNWIALAQPGLAVMVTQLDLFNRLRDTVPLKAGQFGLALAAAVLLLALWEVGKAIARRRVSGEPSSGLRSSGATARTGAGS
jgi:hypothetical protein